MHIQRTANTHNVYFLSPVNSLNSALKHKFTENCHCAAMRMDDDSITSTIAVREQRKKMVTRQKARRIVTPQNNTCFSSPYFFTFATPGREAFRFFPACVCRRRGWTMCDHKNNTRTNSNGKMPEQANDARSRGEEEEIQKKNTSK